MAEYTRELEKGLTTARWADRYPNAGKQSGAFSSGSYDAAPYILMNYQPAVLDHVFTLTHEAGHSMHSYYSARNQPYQYYGYTIFVAEVASTFNEQLLAEHMMKRASHVPLFDTMLLSPSWSPMAVVESFELKRSEPLLPFLVR